MSSQEEPTSARFMSSTRHIERAPPKRKGPTRLVSRHRQPIRNLQSVHSLSSLLSSTTNHATQAK